jgi:hypothetical protein
VNHAGEGAISTEQDPSCTTRVLTRTPAGADTDVVARAVIMCPMSSTRPDRADTPSAVSRARRLVIGTLDRLLPGANPAGTVYGTITVGALLAAESSLRDTYPETIGAVVVALLVYWLAHSYAELLGGRLTAHERLTVSGLGRALGRDWAIVRGAGAPLLALLLAWAVGASQETGVTVGLWTCVASLLAFELLAGLRARAQPAELALELCIGAAMGFGVILLRVILH